MEHNFEADLCKVELSFQKERTKGLPQDESCDGLA
jgi:hypothetical protein